MPKPINMLAPFLIFCVQNQGIEWDANDREFGYGILHQYSQLVDFNAITLVPAEVRNNIIVATSVLKEYRTSWDDLCSSLKDNVVLGSVAQPVIQQVQVAPQPVAAPTPVAQPASTPTPAPAPAPASGEMSMEDKIKAFQEKMAREAEADKKEREAKAAKRKAAEAKPVTAATTTTGAPKAEASAASAVLDEYDF